MLLAQRRQFGLFVNVHLDLFTKKTLKRLMNLSSKVLTKTAYRL